MPFVKIPRHTPTDDELEAYLWPRILVRGTASDYLSKVVQMYVDGHEVWEFSSDLPYVFSVQYEQLVRVLTEMIENREMELVQDSVHISKRRAT